MDSIYPYNLKKPNVECINGPTCRYKNQCKFSHTKSFQELQELINQHKINSPTLCKYDAQCTNMFCIFLHESTVNKGGKSPAAFKCLEIVKDCQIRMPQYYSQRPYQTKQARYKQQKLYRQQKQPQNQQQQNQQIQNQQRQIQQHLNELQNQFQKLVINVPSQQQKQNINGIIQNTSKEVMSVDKLILNQLSPQQVDPSFQNQVSVSNINAAQNRFEEMKEAIKCGICLEMMKQPTIIIPCTHSFCKGCIKEATRLNLKQVCPLCRNQIELTKPNRSLQDILDVLKKMN